MNTPETEEIVAQIILRMEEITPRIEKCLAELTEAEVWQRPNPASNSVGNLVLHLCGNIAQYAISSLGNRPDLRDRDAEFAAKEGFSKAELLEKLTRTVREAVETIRHSSREELMRVRSVQGFQLSGIGIIVHVCEHYSYHTGQIAFWTKILKNKDLGFYAAIDLTVKNEKN
jgi:uncharacterized damage-inducible protein DinB